jgi:FixJ family two-component response regulator
MKPIIYIVDDDDSIRRAMKRLFRSVGMDAQVFASAQEFLDSKHRNHDACMILDIKMPGMSGLELQDELRARGSHLPVIFITGFDSPETRDQAKKAGAAGYFRKPIDDQALLDSIQWALTKQTHKHDLVQGLPNEDS